MLGRQSRYYSKMKNIKIPNLYKIISLLLLVTLMGACERNNETSDAGAVKPVSTPDPDKEDQRIAKFFDEVFERDVSQSPELQAYLGRKTEDYGSWDDYSEENAVFRNKQAIADLARLRRLE
jgi:hypothetical protein